MSVCDVRSAGTRPKTTPVSIDSAAVKDTTVAFGAICPTRGRFAGASVSMASVSAAPSSRPSTPPASAMSRLSASSWRTSRARDAPEGCAQRHLTLTAGGACEEQVGDVRARDEEHERDRSHQEAQVGTDKVHCRLVERLEPRRPVRVGVGIGRRQACRRLPQLARGLFE